MPSNRASGGAPALPGGDPLGRAGDRKVMMAFRKRAGFRPQSAQKSNFVHSGSQRKNTRGNPMLHHLNRRLMLAGAAASLPALAQAQDKPQFGTPLSVI